jgi:hypothetical protein
MAGRKKRKVLGITEDLFPPIQTAGGAAGLAVLGGAVQPIIPAGMANPLTSAGSTLGRFVSPVSAISGAGIALKQVRKIGKKKRRK